jgi:NAD(P)-dependent dehydrogenase (short-subunit alcohol dehydrogenase family)
LVRDSRRPHRRVAVVTGGGGGIGTAAALELARRGVAVVAMDPGVGVRGEPLGEPTAEQTAKLIEAAGGTARASTASVTDREAMRSLFGEVVREFGSLDIVVNTAGILRTSGLLQASEDDWQAVLAVHLGGYLNVLAEALPLMTAAGYGRIVGVTSGAGLARTSPDGPAYGCAKRAVAAVTWQLAGLLPAGITVNALSPIAATRMVLGALLGPGPGPAHGDLDLSDMPSSQDMGPAAAYLAGEETGWCCGQVIFSCGPELSLISPPRLIEGVDAVRPAEFAAALGALVPEVLGPAEARQRTTGGANPRAGDVYGQAAAGLTGASAAHPAGSRGNCVIISDNDAVAGTLAKAVRQAGLTVTAIGPAPSAGPPGPLPGSIGPAPSAGPPGPLPGSIGPAPSAGPPGPLPGSIGGAPSAGQPAAPLAARFAPQPPEGQPAGPLPVGFAAAAATLARAAQAAGGIDAVVIALGHMTGPAAGEPTSWQRLLAGHDATTGYVLAHAGWLQAAAGHAARAGRPVRVVHLADATSAAGGTAAQAVAQLARSANEARGGAPIDVFSVSVQTAAPAGREPVAQLVARLVSSDDATALRGAELVAGTGWIGVRSHPAPVVTVSFGKNAVPPWVSDCLREAIRYGAPAPPPQDRR